MLDLHYKYFYLIWFLMNKIFLLSAGLGNIQRGYESFTKECFGVLSKCKKIDVILFKGAGKSLESSI